MDLAANLGQNVGEERYRRRCLAIRGYGMVSEFAEILGETEHGPRSRKVGGRRKEEPKATRKTARRVDPASKRAGTEGLQRL